MFHLPDYLYYLLVCIAWISLVLIFTNLLYFTSLSILGLKRPKKDYEIVPDQKKFLFLVPAHNEEAVIGPTIESLISQNYSPELYDIVVIADNCTDRTVEIIQSYERAHAFINTSAPDEPRGKPHAIAKYVSTNNWREYDYIAFIDADNIVDKNYLREMNSQLVARPEWTVIQGYLGIKNIATSITATGYAGTYFIVNRAIQYANHRLGWNAAIGGTGFVLNTNYLAEKGWNPRSYTEDFELQVELSIAGEKSGWNYFAIVYDEKPNSFVASHHQRTRWSQGHWYVAFSTTRRQIKSIFDSKGLIEVLSKCQTLVYSYGMIRPVAFLLIFLLGVIDFRLFQYLPELFSLLFFWLLMEIFNFIIMPTVYFLQEGKEYFADYRSFWRKLLFFFRLIISYFWTSLTYVLAQVVGFFTWFRPQNKWRKTVHNATFDRA
ncbi:glycosyltransferase family 2 protein [Lysinibacillus xylanilyticus]|uniref:Glycosyl transferase n=2 Tax=Lysinibacillus xylanilyticus TaxID=582475 RepID=A0A2M9Q8V5_9BACI|nr:glycosyltransferase family 2 protein [Lysinibacillus xylanilyticus]PJO44493.1 hypothetical protein CWD94_06445 [Lysinibacillus xylanilyticus]